MRLYIDPGTGAMLFSVVVGIIGVAGYFLKGLWIKIRFTLSGGKRTETTDEIIPLALFSDDKRYWPVFEPVCRELDKRGFDVVYLTASPDDPALHNPYEHVKAEFIGEGNRAFVKLNFLKAVILLSTTPGLDVYQWKRSKGVKYYIHMPHAPSELTTYRMFGTDHYDAMMLSGQYQIDDCRALEKLRQLPEKECKLIGIPYLDDQAERLATETAQPHERTVLVAPSWGSNSLLNRFGSKLMDQLIATGYHIIIRPHPQSFTSEKELVDRLMADYPQLEWNRETDNFDVLNRSDILISDFSGVIFDFALVFDKPVLCAYTDFDKAPYDAWWLETPIWTDTAIPRLGQILSDDNLNNIKGMIDDCLTDESYGESRNAVREETWVNRGEGAVLAADYLMEKYETLRTAASGEDQAAVLSGESDLEGAPIVPEKLSETAEENNSSSDKGQLRGKLPVKMIGIISAGVLLLTAILGTRSYLNLYTEKSRERGDIELMRAAEAAGRIALIGERVEERAEYWLNSRTLGLMPVSFDRPEAYGRGTEKRGHALSAYEKEDIARFHYDEQSDYRDKIIKLTIDPVEQEVIVEWVESDAVATSAQKEGTD